MTESPGILTHFTDAASETIAREIARIRREASNEKAVRDAEYRARLAELDARIASVATLERQVSDRLATLKDGSSVTADDVMPAILEHVSDVAKIHAGDVAGAIARSAVAGIETPKDGKDADPELIRQIVAESVAELPPAPAGKDADPEVIMAMVAEAVASLPPPKDGEPGKDADPELIRQIVAEAVAELPPAPAGKDADPEVIRTMVAEAVASLPVPKDGEPGRDADPETIRAMVAEAVADLPPAERGEPGPMGALPVVRTWEDQVYYQGDVVSFDGAIYQAVRDTGKAPGHSDWICIVRRGNDGEDGRSFKVCGTFDPEAEYSALDVVALNGASFAARRDNPGPCPGEGWQMIAAQGRQGKPGLKGDKGDPGRRGDFGPKLAGAEIDDEGVLTLTNADGSTIRCDLYPLLSRIG